MQSSGPHPFETLPGVRGEALNSQLDHGFPTPLVCGELSLPTKGGKTQGREEGLQDSLIPLRLRRP